MPEFDYAGAAAPVRLFSADAVLWVAPSAASNPAVPRSCERYGVMTARPASLPAWSSA